MSVLLAVAIVLLISVVLYLVRAFRRPTNFPPGRSRGKNDTGDFGPPWWSWTNLAQELRHQHLVFQELSRRYRSHVLGLRLGGELTVVVLSHDLVHQVLTREEFEGRPDTFFLRLRSMGTRKGITFTDGPWWMEQRRFVMSHFRQLGYGKQTMEAIMLSELASLVRRLNNRRCSMSGVTFSSCLAPSVLNVLWVLTAGNRISGEHLDRLLELMGRRMRAFDLLGGTLSRYPWLRHILPNHTGYSLLLEINTGLKNIIMEMIDEHRVLYDPENKRDLVDAFLCEIENRTGEKSTFTEDQLMMVCMDLFIGGSQTTSNTLDFAFLAMILHPDVQRQVHTEIDAVIGHDRPPALNDQRRMVYTEAVLMEVQRLYHVVPLGGPRRVLRDTTLHNYHIPQNTVVVYSLWSVHMDPEHWGDPHVFRPERFLDDDGGLVTSDWLFPFALGRRRCMGETLARNSIFLFFTGILQKFQVSSAPGTKPPSIEPQPGITLSPQPYSAVLTPRDKEY
uniref:Cytochrome P450 n=1 Tax=Timema monikensis TaxID=170555 RepID=A0A7R9EEQ1_9NEOP|nr:unnamed protein product [Timema monikensis]